MKWLSEFQASRGAPSYQLLACPHAGGWSSSFASWRTCLPSSVQFLVAQLPGREKRASEPNAETLQEIVSGVVSEMPEIDAPLTVIGHSFGAILAYEVVRLLRTDARPVRLLVVSGRQAPCFNNDGFAVADTSDEDLLAHLIDLGGIRTSLINDPRLLRAFVEPIRSDLRLMETYRRPAAPCDVPILAVHAQDDPVVIGDRMRLWGLESTKPFRFLEIQGGHFGFLQEAQARVLLNLMGMSRR